MNTFENEYTTLVYCIVTKYDTKAHVHGLNVRLLTSAAYIGYIVACVLTLVLFYSCNGYY